MKPKILIGIETLLSGGAELFVLRLAKELSRHDEVGVFVLHGDKIDKRVIPTNDTSLRIIRFNPFFKKLIIKIDRLLSVLYIDFSLFQWLAKVSLVKIIRQGQFNVLHSNQFKVDYLFALANCSTGVFHMATVHGDYINFYERLKNGKSNILNFEEKTKFTLDQLSAIVCISDHQIKFMHENFGIEIAKCKKVYNGIEFPKGKTHENSKDEKSNFIFGMVARGIPEKGWEVAIRAFLKLDLLKSQLILVGEGLHLNDLKMRYHDSRIVFAGYSPQPMHWIEKFDVGLLPSTFASESLPTSVIEYLACKKPVIASDVGEIRNVLIQDGKAAGILVPVISGCVDELALLEAMKFVASGSDEYLTLVGQTLQNASLFTLKACAGTYAKLYRDRINNA
jgi:glycosyltransferase involved in cell wall biosynthesis